MLQITQEKLEQKKVNPTTMRLLVLDFLLTQNSALSLSDIERALYPADRITIYRTLKTFEEYGLIHSIDDGTGVSKYALCSDSCNQQGHHDLHLHFYCRECHETHCLPKTRIPKINLPEGYAEDEVSLLIKGICNKCNASSHH